MAGVLSAGDSGQRLVITWRESQLPFRCIRAQQQRDQIRIALGADAIANDAVDLFVTPDSKVIAESLGKSYRQFWMKPCSTAGAALRLQMRDIPVFAFECC